MNLVDQILAIDPFSQWEGEEKLWDPAFVGPLEQLTRTVPGLSSDDLARVLTYANTHKCYYHTELCDLLDEAVKESAKRLPKLQADYQFMIDRACNEKLDGYRALGQRAADAENALDLERREHRETRQHLAEACETAESMQHQRDEYYDDWQKEKGEHAGTAMVLAAVVKEISYWEAEPFARQFPSAMDVLARIAKAIKCSP